MLTYGDAVANIDINRLLDFHKRHGKIGTVTGVRPPSLFGELRVRGDQVDLFTEKPQTSSGLISGGFFVFSRCFLERLSTADNCDLESRPVRAPGSRRAAHGLRTSRRLGLCRYLPRFAARQSVVVNRASLLANLVLTGKSDEPSDHRENLDSP